MALDQHRAGTGEPLVLIHGIGSCWQVWEPILEPLQADFDVLALSLPGYGASPPLAERPTVHALVDAVERVLDEVGWETPHLAGNSMGGWIIAELAARGRAKSATALSPAGLWTAKEMAYLSRVLRANYATAKRLTPFIDRLSQSGVARRLIFGSACLHGERMSPESAAVQVRAYAASPSLLGTLGWWEERLRHPVDLEQIACPFQIVWGKQDLVLPYRQAARWQRIVPGAELLALESCGHVPMVDQPDAAVRAIKATAARPTREVAATP